MTAQTVHTEHPLLRMTLTASGAVSVRHFVKATGAQCTVKGERAIGVSADSASDGYTYPYTAKGTALVVAAEPLDQGLEVTTNANGHAIKATTGCYVNGRTMRAAGIGEDCEIMIGSFKISTLSATTTTSTTTSSTSSTSTAA